MAIKSFCFPPRFRLGSPTEYKKVFTKPVKSTDKFFTLLAIKNDCNYPRLGLAIAKKNIKKAVTRNLIKRIARDYFRLHRQDIINIDIVVLARKDAANASPVLLRKSLERHLLKLVNQCESYL